MFERVLGLLKVKVIRGRNLAVRDISSSDPYVVLRMGKQVYFFLIYFFSPLFFAGQF
jgi:C2 domain